MNKTQKQNGITLIALIITIIVMLILVAVTLVITLGDNGIIAKARTAKEQQALRQEAENREFSSEYAEGKIDDVIAGTATWNINTSDETGETGDTEDTEEDPVIETGVLYAPFATTIDSEDITAIGLGEFRHDKNYQVLMAGREMDGGWMFLNGKAYLISFDSKDNKWSAEAAHSGLTLSGNQAIFSGNYVLFELVDGCLNYNNGG